jgi:hypothetical protein
LRVRSKRKKKLLFKKKMDLWEKIIPSTQKDYFFRCRMIYLNFYKSFQRYRPEWSLRWAYWRFLAFLDSFYCSFMRQTRYGKILKILLATRLKTQETTHALVYGKILVKSSSKLIKTNIIIKICSQTSDTKS